jgi:ribonuclease Z
VAVKFKLKSDMKVCVAFDYMRVKIKDMWKMEKFTPALLELFAEEDKGSANDSGNDGAVANGPGQKKQKQKRNN